MKLKILISCIVVAIISSGCEKQLDIAQIQPNDSEMKTEVTQESVIGTQYPVTTESPTAKPTGTPIPTLTPTVKPTEESTPQPTPKQTEIPTAEPTAKPTAEPTRVTTPEPTSAPEYTVISSQIRSGARDGINEARDEEGNPLATLDSSLNEKAEAHAIEMAKANSLYHSTLGYTESVRSGAFIGGWAEGYGAANHATQLCMDAEIIRIGVGSAMSSDGTVYTCIIGGR